MQQQESPAPEVILADCILVRPIGIIAVASGLIGRVATLSFAVPSGSVGTVVRKLIAEPSVFTFTRPLGVFHGDGVSSP